MVAQSHYRWDFIGLSTDDKPTPAISEKVTDGSTFYCSDNSKLYVWYKNQWYEKTSSGGGGGYVLPIASSETLGGIKVGSNLSIDSETGELTATDTTYSNFVGTDGTTAGSAGLVPAPATTDADKFLKSDGTWGTAGGGSSVTVVQSTGTSTTDVMSQNATTSMIFDDPSTCAKVKIGNSATSSNTSCVAIGYKSDASSARSISIGEGAKSTGSASISIGRNANGSNSSTSYTNTVSVGSNSSTYSNNSIAIGSSAKVETSSTYSVALGGCSTVFSNSQGVVSVMLNSDHLTDGYNSTRYRLITGVHDGQDLHDCATLAQGNTLSASAPTTSTVGVLGQLYTDTTNMHTYQCTAISGDTYTWTQRW